ncbi:type I restriction enzyme, R subunit [Gordonia westfalica]|uniref:Type I restriction enzyme, R subunit n=2 Tax=Gordonia westfalica TaxID=158898 RepID=A0A1H2K1B2_9ACTN|nr:type I restriction enzyme, R subunit [Gordonia westfalica]
MVREAELAKTIEDENLRTDNAHTFVATAFRDNALRIAGTAITKVLSPVSRFASRGGHDEKKLRVIETLGASFEPIFGLSVGRND